MLCVCVARRSMGGVLRVGNVRIVGFREGCGWVVPRGFVDLRILWVFVARRYGRMLEDVWSCEASFATKGWGSWVDLDLPVQGTLEFC